MVDAEAVEEQPTVLIDFYHTLFIQFFLYLN